MIAARTGAGNGIRNRPRARELTPFCGILKVGGMAQQQWGIYNPSREQEMEEEEEECPVLSQGSDGSVESAFGGYAGGNKRRFDEEEEEERSVRLGMGFGAGRVMAVPRRKKMSVGSAGKMIGFGQGQENVRVQVDGDFEDAEFLDYGSLGEVEMGGV